MSKVVVVPCSTYEPEKVYEALRAGLNELGGALQFVKADEKILVKPNFLSASEPEKAVTVHPAVLTGFLRILQEEGCTDVSFGDSPAVHSCKAVIHALKLDEMELYGAKTALMTEEVQVKNPSGKTAKSFWFSKEIVEADALIGISKMKTHALTRITGAVKNFYGAVNGRRKALGHVSYPNDSIFSRQLCDMHLLLKPRLHIMDGIMAMEGNGPASGTPTPMNVLILSADPVAIDTVFAWLVNVDPEAVPTCAQGRAMGVGTDRESEIELIVLKSRTDRAGTGIDSDVETGYSSDAAKTDGDVGAGSKGDAAAAYQPVRMTRAELFAAYGNGNFDVDRTPVKKGLFAKYSRAMTALASRPKIDPEKCVKCGVCVEHCPVPEKAVRFDNGKDQVPVHDYQKCIRCYCCQEMCPQSAITVVRGK